MAIEDSSDDVEPIPLTVIPDELVAENLTDGEFYFKAGRQAGIAAALEVAKRFLGAGAGDSPYVSGMNDSAVRIYQCIDALTREAND